MEQGLTFRLPVQGLSTAAAVFGITGVAAGELMMYPYWCVEKGYARYTGAPDGSPAWMARARGSIRVMHLDIVCSLVIYTLATVAFYLLGAGILHQRGTVPAAKDMIAVLSQIYTGTLGPWAIWPFYAGAIVTLYGTIFAVLAANSRICADMCHLMGLFAGRLHGTGQVSARVRHRAGHDGRPRIPGGRFPRPYGRVRRRRPMSDAASRRRWHNLSAASTPVGRRRAERLHNHRTLGLHASHRGRRGLLPRDDLSRRTKDALGRATSRFTRPGRTGLQSNNFCCVWSHARQSRADARR